MFFDLFEQYGDNLSVFLHIISIISIILYFVTSSDSGSLVIDCLSANGNPDPPIAQRIFWALTEGACATALLKSGGETALNALRSVSMTAGLPYTVILLFMCAAMWRVVKEEAGDVDENAAEFASSIFDVFDFMSLNSLKRLFLAIVAPWWPAGRAAGKVYRKSPSLYMAIMAVLFYGWVLLEVLQVVDSGLAYVGWVVLCAFFAYVVGIRSSIREECALSGNMAEDVLIVVFLYPLAVDQMEKHMLIEEQQKKVDYGPSFVSKNVNTNLEQQPLREIVSATAV